MWIIKLAFTDEPERLSARAAHRQRLAALHRAGVVRMAGPFAEDTGAMIIVDVPDRRSLDEVITDDPYFATPGVRVHQIWHWQPFLQ
jgi:uncharacterized protein YciI